MLVRIVDDDDDDDAVVIFSVVAGKEAIVLTDDELELIKVVVPFSLKEALVIELEDIEVDEALEVGTVVVVVKFNNNVLGSD